MSSGVTFKRTTRLEPLEEGEVEAAKLTTIEPHEFQWEGKTIKKLRWTFTFTDESSPWFGRTVRGETPTSFDPHPSCKAYHWVKAITGKAYEEGEELNSEELIDLPCRVMIEHQIGKDGTIWMRVRDVFPAKQASKDAVPPEANPF